MSSGGFVYAIGAKEAPYVKIGFTTAILGRLRSLQLGNPLRLEVLALVSIQADVRRIEQNIHSLLNQHQCKGEWFKIRIDQAMLEGLVVEADAYTPASPLHDPQYTFITGSLGERVHHRRQWLGLKKFTLAKIADIPASTIGQIERGERCGDHLELATVRRLARALGVTIDYLAGMYEEKE